ncbi:TPA: xylose isomerase [Klebsiella pneumoniae]|nr:xylose isomerase [Klebsiella pneumoniae]HDQ3433327.1 xylose isomerase [Klebsiella pneumoniae]
MKRGVSLYSYQQSQFFKESTLASQINEVANNLYGADGIELIDEMSLMYPVPDKAFMQRWYQLIDVYGVNPVAMDVGMDVLQFRDHVMTHEECAERLRADIRLAKMLGFSIVRVLSIVPLDVMVKALPLAEALDIRIGKEIHQPMALEGQQVSEIIDYAEKHKTRHLGIVPDFGIFGTRPSEAMLAWFERRGANSAASDAAVKLSGLVKSDPQTFNVANQTAGNVRSAFGRFIATGECEAGLLTCFNAVKALAEQYVEKPQALDYTVVAEGLTLSNTSAETLREICPHITHIHAKFNNMSEIPGKPGQYQDIAIDYESAIDALRRGGYQGYLNSEYEGQRYFQDRGREFMMNEFEQVRRHQEMLRRLITA